jgi:hypothetical protein
MTELQLAKGDPTEEASEPLTEEQVRSSLQHILIFGGRDRLRDKEWVSTPRSQERNLL